MFQSNLLSQYALYNKQQNYEIQSVWKNSHYLCYRHTALFVVGFALTFAFSNWVEWVVELKDKIEIMLNGFSKLIQLAGLSQKLPAIGTSTSITLWHALQKHAVSSFKKSGNLLINDLTKTPVARLNKSLSKLDNLIYNGGK
jgi:hypothetical protein